MESFLTAIEQGVGSEIILWFQSWRSDMVTALFQPFNLAGTETFFLILLTLIYWTINKHVGRRLIIVFLISTWINSFCKTWWRRPRPFQVSEEVIPAVSASGFGLPSGHTQTATTVAFALMVEVRKRWVAVVLLLYMFLMGLSRMAHGVHFPQDVLLGWVIGGMVVAIFYNLERRVAGFFSTTGLGVILLITLLTILILLGLTAWVGVSSREIGALVVPVAVLAGGIPGFYLELKSVRFSSEGRLKLKLSRYLVGICVALLIKEGLKPLLAVINDHSLFMEVAVRFTRYFLLGSWIAVGAPWLFVKWGLASREGETK